MKTKGWSRWVIGGLNVDMTAGAAKRWNDGEPTTRDLDRSYVHIPEADNHARTISLRRATNAKLEPEVSLMLRFQEAVRGQE